MVGWIDHFLFFREIEPKLKSANQSFGLLRHLAMDHSFTSGHPLHSTIAQMSFVARSILMREFSIDHIGYGLKPAMWMGRKTCDIVVWVVATKLI